MFTRTDQVFFPIRLNCRLGWRGSLMKRRYALRAACRVSSGSRLSASQNAGSHIDRIVPPVIEGLWFPHCPGGTYLFYELSDSDAAESGIHSSMSSGLKSIVFPSR